MAEAATRYAAEGALTLMAAKAAQTAEEAALTAAEAAQNAVEA